MKECRRCEHMKPLTDFNRSSSHRDGFQKWCRECFREYNRHWNQQHKIVRVKL